MCLFSYKEAIRDLQEKLDPFFRRMGSDIEKAYSRKIRELDIEIMKSDPLLVVDISEEAQEIITSIQNQVRTRPLNLWNIKELEELESEVSRLRREGLFEKQRSDAERRQTLHTAGSVITSEILSGFAVEDPKDIGSAETEKEFKTSIADQGKAFSWRPTRVLRFLSGGKEGEFFNWFYKKINSNIDSTIKKVSERQDRGRKKLDELGITMKSLSREISNLEKTYTADEVIHMYLGMKNRLNEAAIIYGNKVQNIDFLISQLTLKEKAWGDWMLSEFDNNYDRLRAAYILDQNEEMGRESNYFTMVRQDMNYESLGAEIIDQFATRNAWKKAYANKSMTYGRIVIRPEYQKPIKLGATQIWFEQVEKQEHYINNFQHIKDLHFILGQTAVKDAIRQKYGRRFNKWIDKYVNDYGNPNLYKYYDAASILFQRFRKNMTIAYLSYNALTILKQIPSIALFLGRVGPVQLMAGAGTFLSDPKKWMNFVNENDPQMKSRSMNRFMEEMKHEDKKGFYQLVDRIGATGMIGIAKVDKVVTAIGWLSVYNSNLSKGHDEAVRLAQMAVNETQPAGRAKDLAEIYRSSDKTLHFFLMFSNQLNQIFNIVSSDIPAAVRQKQYIKAVEMFAGVMISMSAMILLSGFRPSDDPEEIPEELILEYLTQFVGTIPIAGSGIKSGISGFSNRGVDPFPLAYEVGRALRGAARMSDEGFDRDDFIKMITRISEASGIAAGIPTTAAKRGIKAVGKSYEDGALEGIKELFGPAFKD